MKRPMLLCYNLEGETLRKTRLAAMRFKLLFRPVQKEEYGQRLNALCGYEALDDTTYDGEGFSEGMLVLANYTPVHSQFFSALRHMGVKDIALKAILTPTNGAWNSIQLHHELSLEHEALKNGNERIHKESDPDRANK